MNMNETGTRENVTLFDRLEKATDLAPLMSAMSRGAVIRQTIGICMQLASVILGLIMLWIWGTHWGFLKNIQFLAGLGLVLWQLVFPYALFLAMKLLFLRGREVKELPDSTYVVAPIVATLLTTAGEMVFVFLGVMSLSVWLLVWLSGLFQDVMPVAVPIADGLARRESGFWNGAGAFLGCWVTGFSALLLTRWLREWTMAVFSIAQDVNVLRNRSDAKVAPTP